MSLASRITGKVVITNDQKALLDATEAALPDFRAGLSTTALTHADTPARVVKLAAAELAAAKTAPGTVISAIYAELGITTPPADATIDSALTDFRRAQSDNKGLLSRVKELVGHGIKSPSDAITALSAMNVSITAFVASIRTAFRNFVPDAYYNNRDKLDDLLSDIAPRIKNAAETLKRMEIERDRAQEEVDLAYEAMSTCIDRTKAAMAAMASVTAAVSGLEDVKGRAAAEAASAALRESFTAMTEVAKTRSGGSNQGGNKPKEKEDKI